MWTVACSLKWYVREFPSKARCEAYVRKSSYISKYCKKPFILCEEVFLHFKISQETVFLMWGSPHAFHNIARNCLSYVRRSSYISKYCKKLFTHFEDCLGHFSPNLTQKLGVGKILRTFGKGFPKPIWVVASALFYTNLKETVSWDFWPSYFFFKTSALGPFCISVRIREDIQNFLYACVFNDTAC
jgi:hypothetical protein